LRIKLIPALSTQIERTTKFVKLTELQRGYFHTSAYYRRLWVQFALIDLEKGVAVKRSMTSDQSIFWCVFEYLDLIIKYSYES